MNLCGDILQSSPSLPALQFGKIKHMGSSVIMTNIAMTIFIAANIITHIDASTIAITKQVRVRFTSYYFIIQQHTATLHM